MPSGIANIIEQEILKWWNGLGPNQVGYRKNSCKKKEKNCR